MKSALVLFVVVAMASSVLAEVRVEITEAAPGNAKVTTAHACEFKKEKNNALARHMQHLSLNEVALQPRCSATRQCRHFVAKITRSSEADGQLPPTRVCRWCILLHEQNTHSSLRTLCLAD